MRNIYIKLLEELRKGYTLTLATIIEKKGSGPQIPGASALFSSKGLFSGTVGGGILEADAQEKALRCLQSGASILYRFSLTHDISSEEEAICGGEVTILIDAHPQDHMEVFQSMSDSLSQRQSGVLVTLISEELEGISISRYWLKRLEKPEAESELPYTKFYSEITKSLREKMPDLIRLNDSSLFLESVYPLPHLIIAGAGHIGQAVTHLGSLLDFEVTVIDERQEFANREKLPEADNIMMGDVGKILRDIPVSSDTYIVIVTPGHKNDADALRQCIDSEAAYVGMIGSRRKIELMRDRFLQEGWATQAQWDRIYAPIGVEIQSKTVQEIAVSIAAQLVLVRRQRSKL